MTNTNTTIAARSPLTCMIAGAHESNIILKSALKSRRVRTLFTTSLNVAEAEQAALYPGYYLRAADGNNYWIGTTVDEARINLDKVGEHVLKPWFGYGYDVEYSFGQVVGGGSPWSNISALDAIV